jgi:hypothetical protein
LARRAEKGANFCSREEEEKRVLVHAVGRVPTASCPPFAP